MSVFSGSFRRVAVAVTSVVAFGAACSTTSAEGDGDGGVGPVFADAAADGFVVEAGAGQDGGGEAGGENGLNPLCGVGSYACGSPDNPLACADSGGPPSLPEAGLGSDGGDAGVSGDAASDATTGAVDGDASDAAPPGPEGPDASFPYGPDLEPPPTEAPAHACQVRAEDGEPVRSCEPAGHGGRGAPCTSARDCAPGYGCVGDQGAGQCQRFCCGGPDGCEAGTYCADRPLRNGAQTDTLLVPVCVPADACQLDEPHPCEPTATESCACEAHESCAIVRGDGTTSCVVPGDGTEGESCPCAAGFFCVAGMQTCVKVCRTDSSASDQCGAGRCQVAANFPQGFGLCVGMASTVR